MNNKKTSWYVPSWLSLWVGAAYVFLYTPIVVLVLFSFNKIAFPYRWVGFTFKWYQDLFEAADIWQAVSNSLLVAAAAVTLSSVLGLLFVSWCVKNKKDSLIVLFYPNLMIPEIILVAGLLSFFVFFNTPIGLSTLIVGHTLLGLGYTVPILYTKFKSIDRRIIEASLDLGATHRQTFFKIILPMLRPALVASGLLVFIISLDDFLIAFFCAGTSAQTLSMYIFGMVRSGVTPIINALATLMLVVSSLLVIAFCYLNRSAKASIW